MITRIVKMSFRKEQVHEFVRIFRETEKMILAFDGCLELHLMKDTQQDHLFFTISKWRSEQDLELYRTSYVFKNTWAKVKPLFSEKAEAWSLLQS